MRKVEALYKEATKKGGKQNRKYSGTAILFGKGSPLIDKGGEGAAQRGIRFVGGKKKNK